MLAKLSAKNQLTLPKAATAAVGATEYFDVQTRDGTIILTPVRLLRVGQADAVRAKLAELAIGDDEIANAVAWAHRAKPIPRVAEPKAAYKPPAKKTAKKKA